MERLKLVTEETSVIQSNDMEVDAQSSELQKTSRRDGDANSFIGGPSSWYVLVGLSHSFFLCLLIFVDHLCRLPRGA